MNADFEAELASPRYRRTPTVARTNLRAYTSEDLYVPGSSMTGRMSQYRLALGVKWNPGFYIPMPGDSR